MPDRAWKKENEYCIDTKYYNLPKVKEFVEAFGYKTRKEGGFLRIYLNERCTKEFMKAVIKPFRHDELRRICDERKNIFRNYC